MLGAGLAIDAFSVSVADSLAEPCMSKGKKRAVAGTFAAFQCAMPLIGWLLVGTLVRHFRVIERYIPWAALILLSFIGIKMIVEGIRGRGDEGCPGSVLSPGGLILQGVATSIDALSAGVAMASLGAGEAIASGLIIAAVTYVICRGGLAIGGAVGKRIEGKAAIAGGAILIAIGLRIFFS